MTWDIRGVHAFVEEKHTWKQTCLMRETWRERKYSWKRRLEHSILWEGYAESISCDSRPADSILWEATWWLPQFVKRILRSWERNQESTQSWSIQKLSNHSAERKASWRGERRNGRLLTITVERGPGERSYFPLTSDIWETSTLPELTSISFSEGLFQRYFYSL